MGGTLNGFTVEIDGVTVTDPILAWALIIVVGLICIVAVVALITSIVLAVKYVKFNKTKNSIGITGRNAARKLLDDNGLNHIKVSCTGSLAFGNSYSHYFKKVRLRRLIHNKESITSLAMASQKVALAVMDRDGDPDMKKRVKLTPLEFFGVFAFIPLILIGLLIDVLLFNTVGIATIVGVILGFVIYLISFIMALLVLKTEKKAQKMSIEMLRDRGMATEEELVMMEDLFKLYNLEYVNNLILAALELIYRILQIIITVKGNSASVND